MNGVFLDTVGLLAVWDKSDQWHAPADTVFNDLLATNAPLFTTDYVLFECGNAAARRPYRARVNALRRLLLAEKLLIYPSDEEVARAWQDYDHGLANQAGIVDQISFHAMRRLGLKRAFTNDRHFLAAGFEVGW